MPVWHRTAGWLLVIMLLLPVLVRAHEEQKNPDKVIYAVRTQEHIVVDGVLNDPAWAYASPISDFIQRDPVEGDAPTESTYVQIVYDDEAIYFGLTMFDSEPEKIVKRLSRRDRPWDGDYIQVSLDPYHDHRSGVYFTISAAGIEGDGLMYNDTRRDSDWDGVWDSDARITDRGWVAEIKIPYHVLRFTRQEAYTWGVNITRSIFRKNERLYWVLDRRSEEGWVSIFGHIKGIEKISPPMRLQAIPYTVSEGQIAPVGPQTPEGNSLNQRVGGNLKYGITSNMTVDMTANPDFGQVEADEAVLNLSKFETFFPEKRPFFLEGSQIFDTQMGLFYSRRIGRAPTGGIDYHDTAGVVLEKSPATSILGAAKITGRTQSGMTIGVISAVTAEEFATLIDTVLDLRYRDQIEPLSTYNVVRLKRDILNNSFIGMIATNAVRSGYRPATTGGVDWGLNFLNNMYNFRGQVALSRAGEDQRETGMGTELSLSKRGGDYLGVFLGYEGLSPNFKINDLGFLRRSDIHSFWSNVSIRGNRVWKFTRRRYFNLNTSGTWNFSGDKLRQNFRVNGQVQFKNWWWISGGYGRNLSVQDDLETDGNGLVRLPGEYFAYGWVESDFRKAVAGGFEVNVGQERDGTSRGFGIFSRFRIKDNIEVRFGPNYNRTRNVSRWVENVDDPVNSAQQIPVFGELNTDRFSVVTRANITFTRDLTLQLYNQLFFAAGKYANFKALTSPSTYAPLASGLYTEDPDFNNRSMNVNVVLRWEYRPGSTLFFVWTQARRGEGTPGDAAFWRNLGGVFDASSENAILMKLNYWWNI